eukprot:55415-Eustigmatos_ZCMA.PRE.1
MISDLTVERDQWKAVALQSLVEADVLRDVAEHRLGAMGEYVAMVDDARRKASEEKVRVSACELC